MLNVLYSTGFWGGHQTNSKSLQQTSGLLVRVKWQVSSFQRDQAHSKMYTMAFVAKRLHVTESFQKNVTVRGMNTESIK